MESIRFDPQEIEKFEAIAEEWWDPHKRFKPLHQINPLRLNYIAQRVQLPSAQVLDVGCGGGLLAEGLAASGAHVSGIDRSPKALSVAALHAQNNPKDVASWPPQYHQSDAQTWATDHQSSYDVITCLEVLEHVPDVQAVLDACSQMLKPGGVFFFATLNRTPQSYLKAIIGAEYILGWLPKGTHSHAKFIRPSEMIEGLRRSGLDTVDVQGMSYQWWCDNFVLDADLSVNYLGYARKGGMTMSSSTHQTAALLIIGNEILSGRTRDANAWLANQKLFQRGCRVQEVAIVPDQQAMIVRTLQRLAKDYDAVITSGGIGPTHDDITMDCVAEAWGVPLEEYDEVMLLMRQRYGEQGVNEGRRRMARLPQGAEMIICPATIAPGAKIHNVYVLAGVPHIFASQLGAILQDFGDRPFLRQEISVNLAESVFAAALGKLQMSHPTVEIGSYPARCGNAPSGKICLTSQSEDDLHAAKIAIEAMLESLSGAL